MAATTTNPSLATAAIKLRLLGGTHDGRVVSLAARKCTLGSAADCTLRLRAAGIEPVHCLLDRTGKQTVVLRQAGEAWLNGEPLQRAVLQTGDRLRLGPLEFEVLADSRPHPVAVTPTVVPPGVVPQVKQAQQPAEAAAPAVDELRHIELRFQQLEEKLSELGRSYAAPAAVEPSPPPVPTPEPVEPQNAVEPVDLEQLKAQLASEVAAQVAGEVTPRIAADVTHVLDQKIAARVAGEVANRVSEQVAAQVDCRLTAEVAASTATAVSHAAELLSAQLAQDVADRVSSAVTPVVAAHEAWGQERLAWQEEQTRINEGLTACTESLDRRLASLSQLERTLQDQLRSQPVSDPAADVHNEARFESMQNCLAKLEEQHSVWTWQRDEFRHELLLLREYLADRSDKLGHQLIKLEAKWESFQHEQRRLHTIQDRAEPPVSVRAEHVDHRLAGIRAEREAFEHERHHSAGERTHVHPGEHVKQIDERLAEIQSRRQAGRIRNPLWHEEGQDHQDSEPVDQAHEPKEAPADALQRPEQAVWQPEILADAPSETSVSAVNESATAEREVIEAARSVAAGIDEPPVERAVSYAAHETSPTQDRIREDAVDEAPASPAGTLPDRYPETKSYEEPASIAGSSPSEAVATKPPADEHKKDDGEESIDEYMARLMQRVRAFSTPGGSTPATEPSPRPSETTPREPSIRRPVAAVSPVPPAVEKNPVETPIVDLSELSPRAMPAELTSNISAMRDLANLSARSALDAHSRKRLNSTIYSKLSVAIAALLTAVALTWFARNGSVVTYSAALVSTLVAAVWGLEYLVLSGNWCFPRQRAKEDPKPPK